MSFLLPQLDLINNLRDTLSFQFRPLQRSFHFWTRAIDIYAGYKVFQVRVSFEKDVKKQEAMWEKQHQVAADKIYDMCTQLGGFFLKVAQIIGKPDLAPAAWVKRLVTLCDQSPATPYQTLKIVLENELGQDIVDVFERFDLEPLGSASIAQVHRARLRGDKDDVVVKVQHPGVQDIMMTDIHNLQAFALYMQKTDIKFDLFSITKEMETQIGYEFDFRREADSMQRIRKFLYENNKRSPILVPRVIRDMVTRKVLVMEYMDGVSIMKLGDEIAKRGINPNGKIATAAKHQVALLDYGQVKDLPEKLRIGYANLVLAIADGDTLRVIESFRELGIDTSSTCEIHQEDMFKLAQQMFDTKMPPGESVLQPFSDDSLIKKIGVQAFPEELFSVLRTVQLLRGLSVGLGINYSCAQQWKPFAKEALNQG
ncbi:uncharacterized aarF domain-containing protein kinase 1 isoform X2 [Arachis ipaensis]|uniref:uncharacterized aarF domain-containing protein kinase 1 isoform X2 n=1 Tax=Arachis ipaensis TaxID=130454 RepID=UPI000A2B8FB5|nr:uncharacterized aarF domain-containing protein kinase 1 isoform X2 [Arachis ipaensis]XP_025674192.1 protein ACTIVITY OF BC1 COMPLEX KINASE 8, chloroplastic isoform X1 [Arachis hypogaea]QHN98309.1 putative aarF domain-containing protein kinase [Arachis hypogaea]